MSVFAYPSLNGTYVRLEPLTQAHAAAMCLVAFDPHIWSVTTTRLQTPADVHDYIDTALQEYQRGLALPFATIEQASGTVVGSTRFGTISRKHKRVEIGWTWIAPAWQRTAINTEAKYLMLRYAFEQLGCLRVELKTDRRNTRSQAAIKRLGATQEGVFRKHMLLADGHVRDTVYFSIVDEEWPQVKAKLQAKMQRYAEGAVHVEN